MNIPFLDMLYIIEIICSLSVCLIVLLYWKLTFWKRQSIPNLMAYSFRLFTNPIHCSDFECIKKYGNIIGYYELLKPVLLIVDPDLVEEVLVKEFGNFSDHRAWVPPERPLGLSVAFLTYKRWKEVRPQISKLLSVGNLKKMEQTFIDSIDSMINKWQSIASTNNIVDIRPFIINCFMEILLKTQFGIKVDAINNPNNPILINAKKVTPLDVSLIKLILLFVCPNVSNFFGVRHPDKEAVDFLTDLMEKIIDERKGQNLFENDLIQHFIDEERKGINKSENESKPLNKKELIDNCLVLVAGSIDAPVVGLCHLIYCLIKNPLVQEKLINEVDEYTNSNESLTDVINKMNYLNLCFKETFRLFPPGIRIERKAVKDTKLGNIIVPKDAYVVIPVYALHRDPNNFKNPDQFIPERFSKENIHKVKSGAYVPFATGPRNCVGINLGTIMVKVAIFEILKKFRFERCEGKEELEYKPGLVTMSTKNAWIKLIKRF